MNDSRKLPWLSGLVAAVAVALLLIAVVMTGTVQVINDFATSAADATYGRTQEPAGIGALEISHRNGGSAFLIFSSDPITASWCSSTFGDRALTWLKRSQAQRAQPATPRAKYDTGNPADRSRLLGGVQATGEQTSGVRDVVVIPRRVFVRLLKCRCVNTRLE